ncbi:MAG: TetR/AcrR family transcriptional regulator [Prevotellaceae bacterium]|jgi:AcrR family transcriptional regulator|nr:TetR/AcrR family transcriptional regulator [Prevotellaceae bacterium]
MKKKSITAERDREATEQRLLNAIGEMVVENGFESIGINAVAAHSGVSKVLIYRYFGSIDGLLAAYVLQQDFWLNASFEIPKSRQELPAFLKKMYRQHVAHLRSNPALKMLYRWELSTKNDVLAELSRQKEKAGIALVSAVAKVAGVPQKEVAPLATILSAAITHLVILGDFYPRYNGIKINEDAGWRQLLKTIDALIDDFMLKSKKTIVQKRSGAPTVIARSEARATRQSHN